MTVIAVRAERTYLAGLGASGALIAAAAVSALFLVALVAFEGWPTGQNEQAPDVRSTEVGAPAPSLAAAAALGAGPTTVSATPEPVAFASAGDPESVVIPTRPAPDTGPVTSTPGGSGVESIALPVTGGDTSPSAEDPVTRPLASTVNSTLQTANGTVGMVLTQTPQIVSGTVNGLGLTLNQTVNGLLLTVNGLLVPQGQQ